MRHLLTAAAFAFAFAFAIAAPGTAVAAPAEIVVMGVGTAERPADWANVTFVIIGSGKTSVEALHDLTNQQGVLESRLAALDGAKSVRIETDDLKVSAVRGEACEAGNSYEPTPVMSDGVCAIRGYAVMMEVKLHIAPASQAGNAASLAAELGGLEVRLAGFGVDDNAALREAATREAVQSARAQAETIAKASGAVLGPVIRTQDPSTVGYNGLGGDVEGPSLDAAILSVRAERMERPTVNLKITVPPVRVSSRLSVVFAVKE